MASFRYISCIKIAGHPILPPVITAHDRVQLQKYKEEAIKKEEEITTRTQVSEISDFLSDAETQSSVSYEGESRESTLQTEKVMEFIRQALSDVSHIEEVKLLQTVLFEELQKYTEPTVQELESCDTLHNLDDLSINDGKLSPFSDLSPIKSAASEHSLIKDFRQTVSPLMLNVPNDQLNTSNFSHESSDRMSQISLAQSSPVLNSDSFIETPSKFIRRNSYTLESPSTSVLAYLKSLNKDSDKKSPQSFASTSSKTLSAKKVVRNLTEQWKNASNENINISDVKGLSGSCVELTSLKNPSPKFKLQKHDKNFNTFDNHQNDVLEINKRTAVLTLSNNKRKQKLIENNNITPEMEIAAVKIQAGIRGYLTRRLMKTYKVVELKNTIKDSLITALQLHTEPAVNKAEVELHKRLALQVESVCREWHSIFFEIPPHEKMKIIQVDRNRALLAKRPRPNIRRSIKYKPKSAYDSSDSIATNSTSSFSGLPARPSSLPLTKPSTSGHKPWR